MEYPFGLKYEDISYLLNAINSRISFVKSLLCERTDGEGKSRTEDGGSGSAGAGAPRPDPAAQPRAVRAHPRLRGGADGRERQRSLPHERRRRAHRRAVRLALSILPGQDGDHRHAGGTLQRDRPRLRPARSRRGEDARDLHPALCRIVDSYYRMFIDEPVMRDIWQATQADRALQKLDEEDGAYLAGLLGDALRRIAPRRAHSRAGVVFATDHDADRRRRAPRDHAGRRRKPRACSRCSSGCCRRIWPRWRCREAVELTARTPQHRPGSGSTSAGAGMR